MNKTPRVSIVMPCWNHADHVGDALDGLKAQTFQDFELMIVVDGPDKPLLTEIIRHQPVAKSGLLTLLQENHGTAFALNYGFKSSDGEFWTWVSDDNVMAPTWLECLVTYLDEHPEADAVYSSYMYESGEIRDGKWHATSGRLQKNAPAGRLIENENCYIGPSFLYRRELAEKVGEHRGAISHDYDWWLRFEEKGKIAWLDECLATYRVHDQRVTVLKRGTYDALKWQKEAKKRRATS